MEIFTKQLLLIMWEVFRRLMKISLGLIKNQTILRIMRRVKMSNMKMGMEDPKA